MERPSLIMKLIYSLSVYFGLLGSAVQATAVHAGEDLFPLHLGADNSLKNSGGKSFGPQGIVLKNLTISKMFNRDKIVAIESQYPNRRYVITFNLMPIKDGVEAFLTPVIKKLLPASERHRLSIILNFNKKLTIDEDLTKPEFDSILSKKDLKFLNSSNIPILALFTPWCAYRENAALNHQPDPEEVQESLRNHILNLKNDRQRETITLKVKKEDKTHSFPFGNMRSHMLNNCKTQEFLTLLEGGDSEVFFHIQDSDFTDLKIQPLFNPITPLLTSTYLFKKYDQLLDLKKEQTGYLPIIGGGAYVYSLDEDLSDLKDQSFNQDAPKAWSRFSVEMSNGVNFIISLYNSYGVYFHEPNTLIASPNTMARALANHPDKDKILEHIKQGIIFGINSEINDFTRKLFHLLSPKSCRDLMVFSPEAVVSTSMKRSQEGRPFAVKYSGIYDDETNTFSSWSRQDIAALHGMVQGIVDANSWGNHMATSFAYDRTKDSRTELSNLFNLFDPYYGQRTSKDLYNQLLTYDNNLSSKEIKKRLKIFYQLFSVRYDKDGRGKLMAFHILSAAWETGQYMRLMFLDHLTPPQDLQDPKVSVGKIKEHLTKRFSYALEHHEPAPNSFIITLLDLVEAPLRISNQQLVADCIQVLLKSYSQTKVAKLLGTTGGTVNKLKGQSGSPNKTKEVAKSIFRLIDDSHEDDLTIDETEEHDSITPELKKTLKGKLF